jgi:hypothetical protein
VKVTDNGSPAASGEHRITVKVNEVNLKPELSGVPSLVKAPEQAPINFKVTATDGDRPVQPLKFSLVGTVPLGASIGETSGEFKWTPTEAQGPGTYVFSIRVSDGVDYTDEAITIDVAEVNQDPLLGAIGDRSVYEGQTLGFTLTATDDDVPANKLAYTIKSGAQEGMTLDSTTGAFSWSPTETQDGSYTVVFAVADDKGGEDTERVVITAKEVNQEPVLASPGDKAVAEGKELGFQLSATDGDFVNPGKNQNKLNYSIVKGGQSGMSLDQDTGAFNWTPEEVHDGQYDVTFRVEDGKGGSDEVMVRITVEEVNTAPTLKVIASQKVNEGSPVSFLAEGGDTDLVNPGRQRNTLIYSLDNDAPADASIDSGSGALSWTPSDNGTFTFTVRVMDNGGLSASQKVTITVDNVKPTAVLSNDGVRTYGEAATVSFSSQFDASSADTKAGFRYAYALSTADLENSTYENSGTGTIGTFSGLNAGNHEIFARIIDKNGGYSQYSTIVTVDKAILTVTAHSYEREYGEANPEFFGNLKGVVNGDKVTASYTTTADAKTGVGAYDITASAIGTDAVLANYDIKLFDGTLEVTKAALTVTTDSTSRTYGDANPEFTGTISGIKNGDAVAASYSTAATQFSDVGGYAITGAVSGSKLGNYDVAITPGTLTVNKADQTITWAGPAAITYGTALSGTQLNATAAGVAGGSAAGSLAYTPASGTVLNAGTRTLKVDAAATTNYNAASREVSLVVNKASLTVAAADKSKVYGAANPELTGTLTGVVNGDAITASYSTAATQFSDVTAAGYAITATLADAGDRLGNYTVTNTPGTLRVGQAKATLVVDSTSKVYGQANPAFTGTLGGILNGDAVAASYSTAATQFSDVGGYAITGAVSGSKLGNYDVAITPGTLTVNKAAATISLSGLTHTYDASAKAATATVSPDVAGLSVVYTRNDVVVASPTNAGTYTVTATLSNANYLASTVTDKLVIEKATQTIGFAALGDKTYGDADFTVSASSSSGRAVTFAAGSDKVTVSGTTVHIAGAGTGTVVASLAGDDNYLAAEDVSRSFAIAKASTTTVVSIAPGTFTYTGSAITPATVKVTGAGGLNLSPVASYANNTNAGTATASYTYAESANHLASSDSKTFAIAKATTTITLSNLVQALTGSGLNPTATTTVAGQVVSLQYSQNGAFVGSATNVGVYNVVATVNDPNYTVASETALFVIYDASGGFVTGGGWINSPGNASTLFPDAVGKANFGFVSKYEKGATKPTGNTEFNFQAGNLNFKSTSYEWLTVAGARAQYKGTGTINGGGTYGFMLTAIDGQVNGGNNLDKFRIKIWRSKTARR